MYTEEKEKTSSDPTQTWLILSSPQTLQRYLPRDEEDEDFLLALVSVDSVLSYDWERRSFKPLFLFSPVSEVQ